MAAELAGEAASSASGDGADGAGALIVLLDGTFPSALQILKHSELVRPLPAPRQAHITAGAAAQHCAGASA